jgi:hypothetical protein
MALALPKKIARSTLDEQLGRNRVMGSCQVTSQSFSGGWEPRSLPGKRAGPALLAQGEGTAKLPT